MNDDSFRFNYRENLLTMMSINHVHCIQFYLCHIFFRLDKLCDDTCAFRLRRLLLRLLQIPSIIDCDNFRCNFVHPILWILNFTKKVT
jgi:hypothetical protein